MKHIIVQSQPIDDNIICLTNERCDSDESLDKTYHTALNQTPSGNNTSNSDFNKSATDTLITSTSTRSASVNKNHRPIAVTQRTSEDEKRKAANIEEDDNCSVMVLRNRQIIKKDFKTLTAKENCKKLQSFSKSSSKNVKRIYLR